MTPRARRGDRLRVLSVVGTRPNFMKIAPVAAALARRPEDCAHVLVHTGQHYDDAMSRVFFEQLGIGAPQHDLQVGADSRGLQMARIIERLEPVLAAERPDVVLVPGDVTSTLAAALTCSAMGIAIGHVEAGLRSFDRTMPEEINRTLVDAVSDELFIHSPEARDHLLREGRPAAAIHDVGNTMIDTLVTMLPAIDAAGTMQRAGLSAGQYLVVTLHRPALTDGPGLAAAIERLGELAQALPVAFPVHPRTRARCAAQGISLDRPGLHVMEPLGYVEFLNLVRSAAGVITDSGGIQEETTFLGVPCFTLRDNTERPVTVSLGTNTLLGLAPERIADVPGLLAAHPRAEPAPPPGWDGLASERIADVLLA